MGEWEGFIGEWGEWEGFIVCVSVHVLYNIHNHTSTCYSPSPTNKPSPRETSKAGLAQKTSGAARPEPRSRSGAGPPEPSGETPIKIKTL